MSQTKAQLIQPIGIVTAGGVVVTGVVTASSFDGCGWNCDKYHKWW